MKSTIDMRIGKFRLTNIYRLGSGAVDIKEGLAVETEIDSDGHYCVIMYIRWQKDEVQYENVGTRLTLFVEEGSEWSIVKNLLECGAQLVEVANSVDED